MDFTGIMIPNGGFSKDRIGDTGERFVWSRLGIGGSGLLSAKACSGI
jgi:hypothetical protein